MKVKEIEKVAKNKKGHLNKNGIKPEPNEEKTFKYLTSFGFDIDLIKPTNADKVHNPDILIMGTIWEVKTPTSCKDNTIKNRFREASRQSTKIIFDLRFISKNVDAVEKKILDLFKNNGRVRRLMIIRENGSLIDFIK